MNVAMMLFVIVAGCLSTSMLVAIAFTLQRIAARLDDLAVAAKTSDFGG